MTPPLVVESPASIAREHYRREVAKRRAGARVSTVAQAIEDARRELRAMEERERERSPRGRPRKVITVARALYGER